MTRACEGSQWLAVVVFCVWGALFYLDPLLDQQRAYVFTVNGYGVQTVDLNFLFTYRINAGTVFYVGYDDHYQQADLIEGEDLDGGDESDQLFFTTERRQTNRAVFLKFQYLCRF